MKLIPFYQGKKPIEVAISLLLGCEETEKLYQNYWRLNDLYTLYSIYQEMKDEISNFIDIYRRFKEDHRSPEEISYLVSILEYTNLENYKNKLAESN